MPFVSDPIPALKEQARAEILSVIGKWSQSVAARVLGIDQPRMSDLELGKLDRFSLEKLIRLLAMLDRKIEIRVVDMSGGSLRIFKIPRRPQR